MDKEKLLAGILLVSMTVGVIGYENYVGNSLVKNENIKVIKDTKDIKATDIANVKVDKYEDISGVQWIDENNIIISKLNKEIGQIKIDINTVKSDIDMNMQIMDLCHLIKSTYFTSMNIKRIA